MKRTDRTNWLTLTAAIGGAPMAGAVPACVAAVATGANQQAAHVTATSNARKATPRPAKKRFRNVEQNAPVRKLQTVQMVGIRAGPESA